jgi:hypothetical protein
MKRPALLITTTGAALALAVSGTMPAQAGRVHRAAADQLSTVAPLDSPRGVDALGHRWILVTEGDGTFSLVMEKRHKDAKVFELGRLDTDFAPAISRGPHNTVWLLTGGGGPPEDDEGAVGRSFRAPTAEPADDPAPAATLFKWRPGYDEPVPFVDIAAYQATDPDPFNLADDPGESNPFGLTALPDGSVLVSDAAANDLLRVFPDKHIVTVARLKPRVVAMPPGYPDLPPEEGGPLPPPGTMMPSEAVATSVTAKDGYWYVGELRGFPATPGKAEIWRVPAGTTNATCDPENPSVGACQRFADGLTSIVDLAPGEGDSIYAVELSKMSWLAMVLGLPGSEIGALMRVTADHSTELFPDQLVMPSGVDVSEAIYVTGPIFGPGSLMKIQ